ncbi:MAG: rRNA maturation RNase YbeY [Alphaproteobacteria bacterium]
MTDSDDDGQVLPEVEVLIPCPRWRKVLPAVEETCRHVAVRAYQAGLARSPWAEYLEEVEAIEISIVLADDSTVRRLNHTYRGQDVPTNVLAFAALDEEDAIENSGDNDNDPLVDADEEEEGEAGGDEEGDEDEDEDEDDFGEEDRLPLGDIIVAFETTRAEAETAGIPLPDHLAHLVVHGVLHLLGYDHQEDIAAEEMERLETAVLGTLGIEDPHAARDETDTTPR